MKILIECAGIVPGRHCGIENFIYSWIRGFNQAYPADEIYMNITPGLKSEFIKVLPDVKVVYLEDFKQYRSNNLYDKNLAFNFLVRVLRKLKIAEIVTGFGTPRQEWCRQCEEFVDVVFYPTWKKFLHFNKPVVMIIHDFRNFIKGDLAVKYTEMLKESPYRCLVTSWPEPYKHMLEMFPEYKENSFMIPFQFEPEPADSEISGEKVPRLLLYASSNGPDKNHENLIRALGILKKRGEKPVKIICPGAQVPARTILLDKLVREEQVADWIQFPGFVTREHVKWLYSISSGVITTTKYEAFSGTVMEAFQYAIPVACSRIPSLTSVIDANGICVKYFDPDNPEDIANSIMELINNPDAYKAGALNARRIFSRITACKTVQMYRSVLAWACGQADKPMWQNDNSLIKFYQ